MNTRTTLAELNERSAFDYTSDGLSLRSEWRVGRWGVAWTHAGASRGTGGKLAHLCQVIVITAIGEYDWRPYCRESAHVGYGTTEQKRQRLEKHVAEHGKPWHHCRQPKVGDVTNIRPVCRDSNVRGLGAFGDNVDTDRVDCINCARHFFHEDVAPRPVQEAAAKAARAPRPVAPKCFWCGDRRPATAATKKGEVLPCSFCKEQLEIVWWVQTTGYSNAYFAECAQRDGPRHLLAISLEALDKAYDALERREGRYF